MFDWVPALRRPADRDKSTRVIERVVNEMYSVFARVELNNFSLFGNEPVVGYFDLTLSLDNVDKFRLIAVIMEVVLRKSLLGLEDSDVQVECVNTEFR